MAKLKPIPQEARRQMTEDDEPHGYIECDGDLMGFWLPEDVDPDDLGIEWVAP